MKYPFIAVCLACVLLGCAPSPTATPALSSSSLSPSSPVQASTPTSREPATPNPDTNSSGELATPSPLPTARAHYFEDVDEVQILDAVFPDFKLKLEGDGYQVNGSADWTVWVNDRDEGYITQTQQPELVAVIANQVGANPPKEEAPYGPAGDFLVILERREGKLVLTQRASIVPQISPLASDVRIERSIDVDHDKKDELLVTTNTVQTLVLRTEAHLYRWDNGQLVELWKGLEQDDNTAAVNQSEYFAYQALIDFVEINHDGLAEIMVNGKRSVYPKDAEGRADLTAPASVTAAREVYKWNGTVFVLDPALTTPVAPATPTP